MEPYKPTDLMPSGKYAGWEIYNVPLPALEKLAKSGDRAMRLYIESLDTNDKIHHHNHGNNPLFCKWPRDNAMWGKHCAWPRHIPPNQPEPKDPLKPTDCTKTPYATLKAAREACKWPRNSLKPYQCFRCGLFHLTSKTTF